MLFYPSPDSHKLVFGSQILNFNRTLANDLRTTLLDTPSLEWIARAIQNLAQQWQAIAVAIPRLQEYPGFQHLNGLATWIRTGDVEQIAFPPDNVVLTPLVIVTHLAQYARFLEVISPDQSHWDHLHQVVKQHCEVIGICIGELSAAAVAESSNRKEFEEFGAAAINIAMAIGAFGDGVDLDHWKSIVVGYSAEDSDKLSATLARFPETYVSVVLDDGKTSKTTLTGHESNTASITSELKGIGMTVADIPFRGAFHWPGHADRVEPLLQALKQNNAFKLPLANGEPLSCSIARYIITQTSNWPEKLAKSSWKEDALVVAFGSAATVPPSLATKLGVKLLWQIIGFQLDVNALSTPFQRLILAVRRAMSATSDDYIAVVGMAVRTAGAKDVDEFWDLLSNGPSQHVALSPERHDHQNEWQENEFDKKCYASFISDSDCFDNKFFRKSPRECANMDPQHRLMLETAYQTLESAGYFSDPIEKRDLNVGCYLGIGLAEYERNVSTHPATAYAVTGNITAFAAGKVGHQFGWTGPCLALNAACSSSSVCVDLACKAILSGECNAALAAGVNIICRSEWFNFLGAGSFLSPTGQCKPFDQDADGYCRGEGVGAVYLKKLSTAVQHGDNILGVIAASRCLHNQSTNITAPSVKSLSELFQTVLVEAGLQAKQISVVEAHGTGTQVGDTAEYESIRKVLGGSTREDNLYLGAVKGLVGHTECASGIVSLIKVLSNLHHGALTPHYSFRTINPALNPSPLDNIKINTHKTAWTAPVRAAMVNNYGASGSNVAQVLIEAPKVRSAISKDPATMQKYPVWLCGLDNESIVRYADRLLRFLRKWDGEFSLRDLSFQLSRQSNRLLGHALIFTCSSMSELHDKLQAIVDRSRVGAISKNSGLTSRPVILCFGGQTSRTVGVDQVLYESCTLFRNHLNACDRILSKDMGMPSMYPEIFGDVEPRDIIALQTRLFAVQYACAKAWIESGVHVAAMIGHSFGELTAMCVSGVFSLPDMLKLIVRRAKIIQESWVKRGAMLAVDGEVDVVEKLVEQVRKNNDTIDIACFNGPRNFTLSGSASAIQAATDLATHEAAYVSLKVKPLDVTHAFHSGLVEHLIPELNVIDSDVIWRNQNILVERTSKDATPGTPSTGFVSEHLRKPVYFYQAARRLFKRFPESVWLEAGSNSGVTTMAKHSVGAPQNCHFQHVNVSPDQTSKCLADVTASLWEHGVNLKFWAHHPSEAADMAYIPLPPYQFEKSPHWTKAIRPTIGKEIVQETVVEEPETLWTFVGYQDATKRHARFRVNAKSKKCRDLVAAHVVAQTVAVWPSILQMILAIDAIQSLVKSEPHSDLKPQIQRMENHCALCIDVAQDIWLDAVRLRDDDLSWNWKITGADPTTSTTKLYVSAGLNFRRSDDAEYQMAFDTWERLIDRRRIHALLNDHEADDAVHGRHNIYKLFKEYIHYQDDRYKALHELGGNGNESAGRLKAPGLEGFMDILSLIEPVGQVAGMYLNSLTERDGDDMYISHAIGSWMISPEKMEELPAVLEVLARHRHSEDGCTSDIFAFDRDTSKLYMVVLGAKYDRVPKVVLRKILSTLSTGADAKRHTTNEQVQVSKSEPNSDRLAKHARNDSGVSLADAPTETINIESSLRTLLASLLGVDSDRIQTDSDLADLGVDSLMVMELARDMEKEFHTKFDVSDLVEITDFQTLLNLVQKESGGSPTPNDDSPRSVESPRLDKVRSEDEKKLVNGHHNNDDISRFDHDPSAVAPHNARSFSESTTDSLVAEVGLANYLRDVEPKLQRLCAAYISEAFKALDKSIQDAKPNDRMQRLPYPDSPARAQYLNVLYGILEAEEIIRMDGTEIIRTEKSLSSLSADEISREFLTKYPEHALDCELVRLVGSRLAPFLAGEIDGVQMTFGLRSGKKLLTDWYEKSPSNAPYVIRMGHVLVQQLGRFNPANPIKILEIGGGTGGTTRTLLQSLAESRRMFQYTFSDISPAFVTAAKNAFRDNQNMVFRTLDAENPPHDLLDHFDIVVTTNCLHATHDLKETVANINKLLRADGLAMILEMTMNLRWVNYVFGVFEGWWLFDDGRPSALSSQSYWKDVFEATGFGLVDISRGELPESAMQTIFTAQASRMMSASRRPSVDSIRRCDLEEVAASYTQGFLPPVVSSPPQSKSSEHWLVLTGATGSLGAHLVEYLTGCEEITKVVCLNRKGKVEAEARQVAALEDKGIFLSTKAAAKAEVLDADTSEPLFGLSSENYGMLVGSTSFIVHNAWPLNVKKGLDGFDPQFKAMRNLIDFARECASQRRGVVSFQFVSSTAAQIYDTDVPNLPDTGAMESDTPPEWGYGSAKLVCETILKETLMKFPDVFRATNVRIGQICGSKQTGFWNRKEHLPVILKSSQAIGALPTFEGEVSWAPIDDVAAVVGELLLSESTDNQLYYVENPSRLSWREMNEWLAQALQIPKADIIPLDEWITRVRELSSKVGPRENPAVQLIDHLGAGFIPAHCGMSVLDTMHSEVHSPTLRHLKPLTLELVTKYIDYWRSIGFLN